MGNNAKKVYTEGPDSLFTHNGKTYPLDPFLEKSIDLPIKYVPLTKLSWVLEKSHPDPERVAKADTKVPILYVVTKEWGYVVIDGLHRVAKAVTEGRSRIPAREIPKDWFNELSMESIGGTYQPVEYQGHPGWFEIPGFSGYAANRLGEILTKRTRYKTKGTMSGRYLRVAVYRDGEPKHMLYYTHILVCLAFYGPPPIQSAVVLHKDNDRKNVSPNNLRWGTQSENIKQVWADGLRVKSTDFVGLEDGFVEVGDYLLSLDW